MNGCGPFYYGGYGGDSPETENVAAYMMANATHFEPLIINLNRQIIIRNQILQSFKVFVETFGEEINLIA